MDMPILQPLPYPKSKNFLKFTRRWRVVEPYVADFCFRPAILIPRGFIFDGASIPRMLRNILSPVGVLLIPGLIHDFAYKNNCVLDINGKPSTADCSKAMWDNLFYQLSKEITGLKFISKVAYYAVKFFGHSTWNNYRKGE